MGKFLPLYPKSKAGWEDKKLLQGYSHRHQFYNRRRSSSIPSGKILLLYIFYKELSLFFVKLRIQEWKKKKQKQNWGSYWSSFIRVEVDKLHQWTEPSLGIQRNPHISTFVQNSATWNNINFLLHNFFLTKHLNLIFLSPTPAVLDLMQRRSGHYYYKCLPWDSDLQTFSDPI